MRTKTYALVSGLLFSFIALIHLSRVVLQWEVVVMGWSVPVWLNWVALFLATSLAYYGLKLSSRAK